MLALTAVPLMESFQGVYVLDRHADTCVVNATEDVHCPMERQAEEPSMSSACFRRLARLRE